MKFDTKHLMEILANKQQRRSELWKRQINTAFTRKYKIQHVLAHPSQNKV